MRAAEKRRVLAWAHMAAGDGERWSWGGLKEEDARAIKRCFGPLPLFSAPLGACLLPHCARRQKSHTRRVIFRRVDDLLTFYQSAGRNFHFARVKKSRFRPPKLPSPACGRAVSSACWRTRRGTGATCVCICRASRGKGSPQFFAGSPGVVSQDDFSGRSGEEALYACRRSNREGQNEVRA